MTLSSVDLWLQELMGHPCFMPLGLKIIWHVLNQGAIKCLILDSCQQCLSPHKDWFFKCLLCLLSKGHNILFIRYFFGFLISIYKILFFFCLSKWLPLETFYSPISGNFEMSHTLVNNVRLILQMPPRFFLRGITFWSFNTFQGS